MPEARPVRFAYTEPSPTGTDAPAVGAVRLGLAQPVVEGGGLRSSKTFTVELEEGEATVPLSPGYWYVAPLRIAGAKERWVLVPEGTTALAAVDLDDIDPKTLEPINVPPTLGQSIIRAVADYLEENPVASPEEIASAVSDYLTENPPDPAGVTLVDHPTIPGAAVLTVGPATPLPVVVTHPVAKAAASTRSFTNAAASTDPDASVQWERSTDDGDTWAAIAGATSPALTYPNAPATGPLAVRAVFTNARGSVTSNAAEISIVPLPAFSIQPANVTVADGALASFEVGRPADARVRWERSIDFGRTWTTEQDGTSASLTIPVAASSMSGRRYRATLYLPGVQDSDVVSNVVTLTVTGGANVAPVVTTHPQPQAVFWGETTTVSAAASGVPSPSVQWQRSTNNAAWSDIPGATTLSYTTPPVESVFWLRAVFTNSAGTATTNAAQIVAVD